MKHILLAILNSDKENQEELENFYKQYNILQHISKMMHCKKIHTYEDLEKTLNNTLDELRKMMTMNEEYKTIDSGLLADIFIEISKLLESKEFYDLKENIKDYTDTSIIDFLNNEKVTRNNLQKTLSEYLSRLEETYEALRYDEKLIVRRYYWLKIKVIDTFNWLGGLT